MAPLFTLLGLVPLVLPPATAAGFTWLWRSSLSRPWLFFVCATLVLYLILGSLVVLRFRGIGISGVAGPEPALLDSFQGQLATVFVGYLVLAALASWALRFIIGKL